MLIVDFIQLNEEIVYKWIFHVQKFRKKKINEIKVCFSYLAISYIFFIYQNFLFVRSGFLFFLFFFLHETETNMVLVTNTLWITLYVV